MSAAESALVHRPTIVQFLRFLVVGALNTAFGYAVFAGLVLAGMPPMPALVVTYVVGVVFNFATTGRLVFGHAGWEPFVRFVAAYVAIYLFNVALYHVAARFVASPLVAQASCVPVVAVVSFAIFRLRVFVRRP